MKGFRLALAAARTRRGSSSSRPGCAWAPPPGEGRRLRVGRLEFVDGTETAPGDPTVAAVKRDRVAHRVLGNFG